MSLSAGWRWWRRWWWNTWWRSRGSNYQVPALSCLPESPLCKSCSLLPDSLLWKSLFYVPWLNIKVRSSICRSLLSLGMTSGMAGEGVGGSVGELEMAAWLQQVFNPVKQRPFTILVICWPAVVQVCVLYSDNIDINHSSSLSGGSWF